jgi:outer membrane protein assembly factor BamD (BamD/ComL family)
MHFDPARQEWVLETPPVPGTAEGDLRLARAAHAAGDNAQAQKAVAQWIKTYGELDERYPEAVLLRCRIMIARKDYYTAHKALQSFLNEFGGTTYVDEALTMEFVVADVFLGGVRRKFLGLPILKADDVGIAILDDIANNHPDTSLAELAVMAKANYYYFKSNDYPFAEQEYGGLLEAFPRSRYVRRAMLQSARAALASFPGVEFDDAPLVEAEERFRQYLVQYPGTAEQEGIGLALTQIAEQRAEKEYTIGRYYERTGHARAAAFYYRSTLDNWPEAIAAVRATERLQGLGLEPPQEGN